MKKLFPFIVIALSLFSCSEKKEPVVKEGEKNASLYQLTVPDTLDGDFGNNRRFIEFPGETTTSEDLDRFLAVTCKGKTPDETFLRMVSHYDQTYGRLGLPNDNFAELHTPRGTNAGELNQDSIWLHLYKGGIKKILVNPQAFPVSGSQMINKQENLIVGFGRKGGVTFRIYDSALHVTAERKLDLDETGSVIQLFQKGDDYITLVQCYNVHGGETTFIFLLDAKLEVKFQTSIKNFMGEQLVQVKDQFFVYGLNMDGAVGPAIIRTDFGEHYFSILQDGENNMIFNLRVEETPTHYVLMGMYLIDKYDPEQPVVKIAYKTNEKNVRPILFRKSENSFYVMLKINLDGKEKWLKYLLEINGPDKEK